MCEGLEARLGDLCLDHLNPPLQLCTLNIDSLDMPQLLRARYSLEVPVLLVELDNPDSRFELEGVSPRLEQEGLFNWLQKAICKKMRTS